MVRIPVSYAGADRAPMLGLSYLQGRKRGSDVAQDLGEAMAVIDEVFERCDRAWRGVGTIPGSGFRLRERYAGHDAERKFDVAGIEAEESPLGIAGEILQGRKKPHQCPAFGCDCTPEHPLGAPMVSSEGACAAYHRYARIES